ncbi:hypothetical protein [Brucella intermedia]|uniref:hypothetical protein n=1 Tax=Brucella intermedia TaxID=94625 RepID=UPI002447B5C8|nr:hypothetical protein [Brucella intermedia]WGG59459.1 hypothetical protein QA414_00565 [Brucella intermedia]
MRRPCLGEPLRPRRNERAARSTINDIAFDVPLRDHHDAIAELDKAVGRGLPSIVDGDAASPKGVAMRKQESHLGTFSFSDIPRPEDRAG